MKLKFKIQSILSRSEIKEDTIRQNIKDIKLSNIDVNSRNIEHRTPLHLASIEGDIKEIELLLKKGARLDDRDYYGNTPLSLAVHHNKPAALKKLLDRGAQVNTLHHDKMTPLHYAAEKGYVEVVELLLEKNVNLEAQNWYGRTALHLAKNAEVSQLLLSRGAKVDILDDYKYTPLHLAVIERDSKTIELLLKNGANINAKNEQGWTPLYIATSYQRDDLIGILIENEAELTPKIIQEVLKKDNKEFNNKFNALTITYREKKAFSNAYHIFCNLLAFIPVTTCQNQFLGKSTMSKIANYLTCIEVSPNATNDLVDEVSSIYNSRYAANGVSTIKKILTEGSKANLRLIMKQDAQKTHVKKYIEESMSAKMAR